MPIKKLLLLSLLALPVSAEESFQLSGFGSIGTVSVDSDYYGYRKDVAQDNGSFEGDLDLTTTSILGVQFDYLLNQEFELVYQAVYRDQNELSIDSMSTMAFLKYTPSANWSYRIGRTPLDLFLLTEYRDVDFASTWAHAPNEVYGLVPYRHLDGFDISHKKQFNQVTLHSKFFSGKSESDVGNYHSPEKVTLSEIYGLSFGLESFNWSIISKLTSAQISNKVPSTTGLSNGLLSMSQLVPGFNFIWPESQTFAQSLVLKDKKFEYASLGAHYDHQQWSFLAEVSKIQSNSDVIRDIDSGYVSTTYHTDVHSFYATYAYAKSDRFDISDLNVDLATLSSVPGGIELYYSSEIVMNFFSPNQTTLSLGWRWNLTDNTALNLQWDRTKIDAMGGTLWLNRNFSMQPEETVNSIFTSLSFSF